MCRIYVKFNVHSYDAVLKVIKIDLHLQRFDSGISCQSHTASLKIKKISIQLLILSQRNQMSTSYCFYLATGVPTYHFSDDLWSNWFYSLVLFYRGHSHSTYARKKTRYPYIPFCHTSRALLLLEMCGPRFFRNPIQFDSTRIMFLTPDPKGPD